MIVPSRRNLVVGGSGFIGRHVVAELVRLGEPVLVLSRTPLPINCPPELLESIEFIACDYATADWDQIIRDGDVIHQYAWSTIPETATADPISDLDQNVRATLRLLTAAAKRSSIRVVFSSSGGTVYGKVRQIPIREDHTTDPITPYGVSKLMIEKYLGYFGAVSQLDVRIARISNPFGVGQDSTRRQGAIRSFLQKALAGETIEIWGTGSVIRDYVHITDVASALVTLSRVPTSALGGHTVFNIGSGVGTSLLDVVRCIEIQLDLALDLRFRASRAFDVPANSLDISRMASTLNWRPRLDLGAGIQAAFADMRDGKCLSTIDLSAVGR